MQPLVPARAAEVTFVPGPHTTSAEFVDSGRRSYQPPIADPIEITAR